MFFDDYFSSDETYWINNQIALNLIDKLKEHCENYLQYTSEGHLLENYFKNNLSRFEKIFFKCIMIKNPR